MINSELIILSVQIIAALGVLVSVIYLGVQIRQQNKIAKAEFGHHLTQRLYDRSFQTSKDKEFSEFLSSDWTSKEVMTPTNVWRAMTFVRMCLVDIFDVYDKVQSGLVEESHLSLRMKTLKMGTMKSLVGRGTWLSMRENREDEFIEWFEMEIYGELIPRDEEVAIRDELNMKR